MLAWREAYRAAAHVLTLWAEDVRARDQDTGQPLQGCGTQDHHQSGRPPLHWWF